MCDPALQVGAAALQSDVARKFVVIGDGEMNPVEAPIGRRCGLHLIYVFGCVRRIDT